jgi:hypothetical protein
MIAWLEWRERVVDMYDLGLWKLSVLLGALHELYDTYLYSRTTVNVRK